MLDSIRRTLIVLAAGLTPAILTAQTPPAPAAVPTETNGIQIVYEPGRPSKLPVQTCEVQTKTVPRPHTVTLPAHVKAYVFNEHTLEKGAQVFEETISAPRKLDQGFYVFEVEGQKDPIYVAYDIGEAWQTYVVLREPEKSNLGNFFIPGFARLPTGSYQVKGARFDLALECRNLERAVIEIPTFDSLPPFLEPAAGISW